MCYYICPIQWKVYALIYTIDISWPVSVKPQTPFRSSGVRWRQLELTLLPVWLLLVAYGEKYKSINNYPVLISNMIFTHCWLGKPKFTMHVYFLKRLLECFSIHIQLYRKALTMLAICWVHVIGLNLFCCFIISKWELIYSSNTLIYFRF